MAQLHKKLAHYKACIYSSPTEETEYNGINPNDILNHSNMIGYPLFRLTELRGDNMYYGMAQNDFIKVFGEDLIEDSCIGLIEGDEYAHTYILMSKTTLETIRQIRNIFDIYVFQRIVFPEDKSVRNNPTKKIEYDVCYQLICGLSDILVFKHQKNILGYRADLLLELKSASFDNIPGIVVEIDEDSHKTYEKGQEDARKTVLEHFVNRVIKIPVKRSSTSAAIQRSVQIYITQIRNLFTDLIYEYTSEITEEQFYLH